MNNKKLSKTIDSYKNKSKIKNINKVNQMVQIQSVKMLGVTDADGLTLKVTYINSNGVEVSERGTYIISSNSYYPELAYDDDDYYSLQEAVENR